MTRISKDEIYGATGLFYNAVFDGDEGWTNATYQEWMDAVYEELTTWKTVGGHSWHSNENRFEGKDKIIKMIRPILNETLTELKEVFGYDVKAYNEINH